MSTTYLDSTGVVSACPSCGQKNRTPYSRIGDIGHCGKCRSELPKPSTPINIADAAQFDRLIGESALPVVVDFWAPWCGPCRMMAPELDRVAEANAGRYLVAKLNTEALPALAQRFSVSSIPMLGVFIGGREAARTMGARPARDIEAFIRQTMGN